jgi:hypothetical protein
MLPTMVAAVCALVLGQAAHAASWDDTLAALLAGTTAQAPIGNARHAPNADAGGHTS